MSGPSPLPTALKVLEGNPGKRPLPENEPKPDNPSLVCPDWLTDEAKILWNKYALVIKDLGVFKQTDEMSFATLCQEMGRYIELQKIMNERDSYTTKNARGGSKPYPEMAMARECLKNIRALMAEFGMTPSSRTRLSVSEIEEDDDPIAEILRRKQG